MDIQRMTWVIIISLQFILFLESFFLYLEIFCLI